MALNALPSRTFLTQVGALVLIVVNFLRVEDAIGEQEANSLRCRQEPGVHGVQE